MEKLEEQNKKLKQIEIAQEKHQHQMVEQQLVMNKMTITLGESTTFSKRMALAEQKIDAMKEYTEKRNESIKDYVNKTKEMLETRSDYMVTIEERLIGLKNDVKKITGMQGEFQN